MGRVEFLRHNGKRILFIDLSNCSENEVFDAAREALKMIKTEPGHSVLTLTSTSNAYYGSEAIRALKYLAKHDKPYVKAAAVVGVSGLQKLILVAVEKFSKRHFAVFDDMEEAKEWLVKF